MYRSCAATPSPSRQGQHPPWTWHGWREKSAARLRITIGGVVVPGPPQPRAWRQGSPPAAPRYLHHQQSVFTTVRAEFAGRIPMSCGQAALPHTDNFCLEQDDSINPSLGQGAVGAGVSCADTGTFLVQPNGLAYATYTIPLPYLEREMHAPQRSSDAPEGRFTLVHAFPDSNPTLHFLYNKNVNMSRCIQACIGRTSRARSSLDSKLGERSKPGCELQ